MACAKAKARCDNRPPSCTRCVVKRIECRPQIDSSGGKLLPGNLVQDSPRTRRPLKNGPSRSTPTRASPSFADINTLSAGSQDATIDLDVSKLGGEQFGWDMLDMDVTSIEDLDDQTINQTLLDSTSPSIQSNEYGLTGYLNSHTRQMVHVQCSSIPTMPAYELRSFAQNPAIKGGPQPTAMLMVRMLTSYPMMMRSQDSLPPFIHPSSLSDVPDSESKSVESLITCMSLMQMISTRAQGSRKLLWKNVRLECERLQGEVSYTRYL